MADDENEVGLLKGFIKPENRWWYPWTWPEKDKDYTKQFIEMVRKLCREDFFFFCDEITRDRDDPHLDTSLHAEMCHIVQLDEECGALVPRYHLKSTICTVAHSLWRLIKDPNTRILLKAATEPVAEGFLYAIKQHILGNKRLHLLFPELCPALLDNGKTKAVWNQNSIQVNRDKIYSEPSVFAVGAKTNLTGMHFDLAIYDDLMAEENAKNIDTINEIIRKFEADIFLMVARSRRFLVGTRYDDRDLYGHLMDKRAFEFYVRAAYENNRWIWRNKDVIEKIKRDKQNSTPYVYSCQMMNSPIDKETQEFKSDYTQYWSIDSIRREMENPPQDDYKLLQAWYSTLDIYLGLDPARADNDRKINSSIAKIAVGVDSRGREFLLERVKTKGEGSTKLIENWVAFIVKWSKYPVRYYAQEATGGDNHLVEPVRKLLKENKLPIGRHHIFTPSKQENKDERIRELQLPWENRQIILHATDHEDVEQEFARFPRGREKDTIDIWSHLHRGLIRPKKEAKNKTDVKRGWRTKKAGGASEWNWKTS